MSKLRMARMSPPIAQPTGICHYCAQELDVTAFNRQASSWNGRTPSCARCRNRQQTQGRRERDAAIFAARTLLNNAWHHPIGERFPRAGR